ncbi:MAG TPA: tyrosine-type recombinase/integrase [Blastocatellia bacterium]|nr:tyrosine-type recombinase/integrase [Blastocatellia bacterium]
MPSQPAAYDRQEITPTGDIQPVGPQLPGPLVFDQRLADPFVYKSISESTRRTYRKAIKDFFTFVKYTHPTQITPAHVIQYRDHLIAKNKSANTIALKLSVIRSFYDFLVAAGVVESNPASTKLVSAPPVPDTPSGRALTPREVRHLLAGPDRSTPTGARDYALMLVMLRLSLRVSEACSARLSDIKWSHGRWVLTIKVKRGREEKWPVPSDVKQAIDDYLRLDRKRRSMLRADGADAYVFQPQTNYRTLEFAKGLSSRQAHKIIRRWAEYGGVGKVSPHDLRRTVITKLLDDGRSYREVQMVTKHRDPRSVQRYDHGRENLDNNPVNTLSYDEDEG